MARDLKIRIQIAHLGFLSSRKCRFKIHGDYSYRQNIDLRRGTVLSRANKFADSCKSFDIPQQMFTGSLSAVLETDVASAKSKILQIIP
jgi:hypothetical protein